MITRVKQIVTSALAFGVLAIPGFASFITAIGGDAAVMQAVAGAFAVYHLLRLVVDTLHGAVASVFILALLLPATASAQAPEPVEGQHGAVYLSYALANGQSASLDNLQLDLDLAVPGTVLSGTVHVSDAGAHVGPRGAVAVGPVTVFGHHLFFASGREAAAQAIGNKTGGGVEVPLPRGAVLRFGLNNHANGGDGVDEFTVGIGARF